MLALTLGTIGINLCIQSVQFACVKSFKLFKYLTLIDNTNIDFEKLQSLIYKTDIKQKIIKFHKLLLNVEQNELKDCIQICIKDVWEKIDDINIILEECLILNRNHKNLYLNKWRYLDLNEKINKLDNHIHVFNIRIDDLIKMMTIISLMNTNNKLTY